MWNHMKRTFGEDWRQWPIPGCGAGFSPWKNGPSMVLVMCVGGEWISIQAERPPTVIEDAFKNMQLMNFAQVEQNIRLDLLWDWLPNAYPMDPKYADVDGYTNKRFLGVSRYPLDRWERDGRPYMTDQSWIVTAMLIAAGESSEKMKNLMMVAFGMYSDDPKTVERNRGFNEDRLRKMCWEKFNQMPTNKKDVEEYMKQVKHGHAKVMAAEAEEKARAAWEEA